MNINHFISNTFDDFYFIFNTICDLFNYLVIVVICFIIDIFMVVKLRRTLNEKTKKSESMNKNQNQDKKAENEKVVKKAIKMVVLNSLIGIFFKIPVSLIPLVNVYAEFYYKDMSEIHLSVFNRFYKFLINYGFYSLIQDVSHLLFSLSLATQFFIYKRFDKKFQTGYTKLTDKASSYITNIFKSKSNS